jgi:hypothetical protein
MKSIELNIPSPTKPFLNINEVVAAAESFIDDTDDRARVLYRTWAWLGEQQLGFGAVNVETKDIVAEDLSIRKPSNMAKAIDVALYDAGGTEYQYKYQFGKGRIHSNTTTATQNKIDLSEDAYYYHLGTNASGITYATLRYYAYPIDDENNPMFPNHHMLALMMFIRWMWELRKNDNQSAIDRAEANWVKQSTKAKAANKMPDMLQGKEIATTWMSMIDKARHYDF